MMKFNKPLDNMINIAKDNIAIEPEFYDNTTVFRGLRNPNGTGVTVGLTKVGAVYGYKLENEIKYPQEGQLFYRGIGVDKIVSGFLSEQRRGFEETIYLLLFGQLPNVQELKDFNALLDMYRELPEHFIENMILKIPSKDIMNKLQRSILVLYSHDDNPDDVSLENLILQSIKLISRFPTIISYGYQAKAHYYDNKSLFIHTPKTGIGTAENILHLIRSDNQYTHLEAQVLDLCLVIHAEHGGGNNSAFTTHVVSSSGTDTYSAISAAVGALKGFKHGGANNRVCAMIDDIKAHCKDWRNPKVLKAYLVNILEGKAFSKDRLIYGMGHAVYTLSDPRAELLKEKARALAKEKNALDSFMLYHNIEVLTKEIFKEKRGDDFAICANVDLYSGLVYDMLGIPRELFTPLFATARVASWCAHRIEQIVSDTKIMRPAYKNVPLHNEYISLKSR